MFAEAVHENTVMEDDMKSAIDLLKKSEKITLSDMFYLLSEICKAAPRPMVLMIDEVDSASNNQVFVDFLAMLRKYYIKRRKKTVFYSVVLAGVYDIKNLKLKLRSDEEHQYNSPWNIAADFDVEMAFSADQIAAMLQAYETDHGTGMDVREVAGEIYQYTSGYPYLVSALCKLMDERLPDDALKPIINGTGNYYIEAQTRDAKRTDVVVDYLGEQFIVELKIWHGNEYHERGEAQLAEYLDYFHQNKGYMLSFNFNKKKETGIKIIRLGEKTIIEAVV